MQWGKRAPALRLLQPPLKLLQGDAALVAPLFLRSGLLAPGVEIAVADAPGLDPRETAFVLSAVDLEHRVVRLLQRPLLERTYRPAACLAVERCAVAVLRADAACLGKVAPTVLAAPHGDVALHAGLQTQTARSSIPIHSPSACGRFTPLMDSTPNTICTPCVTSSSPLCCTAA